VLGTAIGPVYLSLPIVPGSRGHFSFSFAYLLVAAPISALSTLIYLLFLRLLLRRSQRSKTSAGITLSTEIS
jgi:hypothetical protein